MNKSPNMFKERINKIVPLVYDDSLSVYEWLNHFVKAINDFVDSIAINIDSKLNRSEYEADKETFEIKSNKVGAIFESASSGWYPTVKAVIDYVKEKAITKDDGVVSDVADASDDTVFSSNFVKNNYLNSSEDYAELNTSEKTIFGAINECASLISNPNVLVADYGSTLFETIKTAFSQNRTIIVKKRENNIDVLFHLVAVAYHNNEPSTFNFALVDNDVVLRSVSVAFNDVWHEATDNIIFETNLITDFGLGASADTLPYSAKCVYDSITDVKNALELADGLLDTKIDNVVTNLDGLASNVTANTNDITALKGRGDVTMKTVVVDTPVTFTDGEARITGLNVEDISSVSQFRGSVVVNGLATGECFCASILDATAEDMTVYVKCLTSNYNGAINVRLTFSSL